MMYIEKFTWAAPALAATQASANVSIALWKSIPDKFVCMVK